MFFDVFLMPYVINQELQTNPSSHFAKQVGKQLSEQEDHRSLEKVKEVVANTTLFKGQASVENVPRTFTDSPGAHLFASVLDEASAAAKDFTVHLPLSEANKTSPSNMSEEDLELEIKKTQEEIALLRAQLEQSSVNLNPIQTQPVPIPVAPTKDVTAKLPLAAVNNTTSSSSMSEEDLELAIKKTQEAIALLRVQLEQSSVNLNPIQTQPVLIPVIPTMLQKDPINFRGLQIIPPVLLSKNEESKLNQIPNKRAREAIREKLKFPNIKNSILRAHFVVGEATVRRYRTPFVKQFPRLRPYLLDNKLE